MQVKEASSEQIKHGGCLGLGLAAMGTHRADVYEQLKFCLYQVGKLGLHLSCTCTRSEVTPAAYLALKLPLYLHLSVPRTTP